MYISRNANGSQTVACHEHTTIVFQHSLAIGSLIVQRQHHSHPDFALTQVLVRRSNWLAGLTSRSSLTRLTILRWEGNLNIIALLELVSRGIHLWIGLNQFVNSNAVFTGYSKDGLLTLYLMQFLIVLHLRQGCLNTH